MTPEPATYETRFSATKFIGALLIDPAGDSIAFQFANDDDRGCMISMNLATFQAWLFAAQECAQRLKDDSPTGSRRN